MKQQGLICGFRGYTPAQLEKMKQDLAITMPLHTLARCEKYYREVAARDPYIEELLLLDRLASAPCSAAELTLTELTCTDRFAAQTYSDLLEKRRTVYPDRRSSITLAEMLSVCEGALRRAGKRTPLANTRLLLEHRGNTKSLTGDLPITQKGSRVGLRLLPSAQAASEHGVKLLVLIRAVGNTQKSVLSVLYGKQEALPMLQAFRPIGDGGLLREILSVCNGANIAPDCLSLTGEPLSLAAALCGKEDAVLATVMQEDFPTLSKLLSSLSLSARSFGAITDNGRISILEKKTERLTLRVPFLRSLLPTASLGAELRAEAITKEAAYLSTAPQKGLACAYLIKPETETPPTVVDDNGTLCAGSHSAPSGSFFLNAVDTALASVLSLAASGIDYTAQSLAVALAVPKELSEPQAAGEAVSALLGLYRLQAELSLSTSDQTVLLDDIIRHPEITVYAAATGNATPARLTREGAYVYCLSPHYFATGLPDFDSVRSLLGLLTSMRRDGILTGARVIARKTVAEGLKELYTDDLVCNLTGHALFSADVLRLGVLIETAKPIEARRVGIVAKRSTPREKSVERVLPKRTCLLPTESPAVTVYANRHDRHAVDLAELLRAHGATVHLCSPQSSSPDRLAHAILSSQTLLVCKKATIPNTQTVAFALHTLRSGGGRILLLHDAQLSNRHVGGFVFEHGIPQKALEQICHTEKQQENL